MKSRTDSKLVRRSDGQQIKFLALIYYGSLTTGLYELIELLLEFRDADMN